MTKEKDLILERYRNLRVLKFYTNGRHADEVSLVQGNIIRKKYSSAKSVFFKRESSVLKKLRKCNFVPKLLCVDKEQRTIYMAYCGLPIPKLSEYETQINHYIKTLKTQYGIYHNDIKKGNICLNDKQLYLIDFSWANTVPYKVEENRPGYNTIHDHAQAKKKEKLDRAKKVKPVNVTPHTNNTPKSKPQNKTKPKKNNKK